MNSSPESFSGSDDGPLSRSANSSRSPCSDSPPTSQNSRSPVSKPLSHSSLNLDKSSSSRSSVSTPLSDKSVNKYDDSHVQASATSAYNTANHSDDQQQHTVVVTSLPSCQNCHTGTTPLWRRDDNGQVLCNACGLFLKLHGRPRPISLKSDVIKSRNRGKHSNSTTNVEEVKGRKKSKKRPVSAPSRSPVCDPPKPKSKTLSDDTSSKTTLPPFMATLNVYGRPATSLYPSSSSETSGLITDHMRQSSIFDPSLSSSSSTTLSGPPYTFKELYRGAGTTSTTRGTAPGISSSSCSSPSSLTVFSSLRVQSPQQNQYHSSSVNSTFNISHTRAHYHTNLPDLQRVTSPLMLSTDPKDHQIGQSSMHTNLKKSSCPPLSGSIVDQLSSGTQSSPYLNAHQQSDTRLLPILNSHNGQRDKNNSVEDLHKSIEPSSDTPSHPTTFSIERTHNSATQPAASCAFPMISNPGVSCHASADTKDLSIPEQADVSSHQGVGGDRPSMRTLQTRVSELELVNDLLKSRCNELEALEPCASKDVLKISLQSSEAQNAQLKSLVFQLKDIVARCAPQELLNIHSWPEDWPSDSKAGFTA